MVLQRHRLVHLRDRIHQRPLALRDGDRAELFARRPEELHVPTRGQRVRDVAAELAVPRLQDVHPVPDPARGVGSTRTDRGLQRSVAVDQDHVVDQAGLEGEARVLNHRADGGAGGPHRVHHRQVLEPERELQSRIHVEVPVAVEKQAVDVGLGQTGVVESKADGLGGEVRRRAPVDPAHTRHTQTDDRRVRRPGRVQHRHRPKVAPASTLCQSEFSLVSAQQTVAGGGPSDLQFRRTN